MAAPVYPPPSAPAPGVESSSQKFLRKMKEQPLVPIGCVLTCGALVVASKHLRTGNRERFNQALRWRVGFQGLTVLGAVVGTFYYNNKEREALASSSGATQHISSNPLSAERDENRRKNDRLGFNERLGAAEAQQQQVELDEVEKALLADTKIKPKSPPIIGQDTRRV